MAVGEIEDINEARTIIKHSFEVKKFSPSIITA
jgi:rhamnulokinase